MKNRQDKRKDTAILKSVIHKAKVDMQKWMTDLPVLPSENEIRAFQAGYIAGMNRGSNNKE